MRAGGSRLAACGDFPLEAGSRTEASLFWMAAGAGQLKGFPRMAHELIGQNLEAAVLVAYLRLD